MEYELCVKNKNDFYDTSFSNQHYYTFLEKYSEQDYPFISSNSPADYTNIALF